MVAPERTIHFAGLDRRSANEVTIPDYYGDTYGVAADECRSFSEVLRQHPRQGGLYSAETTSVSWEFPLPDHLTAQRAFAVEEAIEDAGGSAEIRYDEDGAAWVSTDRFNAVYSPEKIESWLRGEHRHEDADGTRRGLIDPLWKTFSDSYTIINPATAYGPLENAIREHDLASAFYGQFRTYNGGGTFVLDGLFDTREVELPGEDDPVVLGFTSGGDYFGNRAFYAEGFAQDTACTNSMRNLTDRLTRRHVGEPGEFTQWWEAILTKIDVVADELHQAIREALDVEIPLFELPFDLTEFFELQGFPAEFARLAAGYTQARAEDRYTPNAWELHSGVTAVLEHEWDNTEGSTFRGYVRMSNDLLFNPHQVIEQVEQNYEYRIEQERQQAGDGQQAISTAEEEGLATLAQVSASVADRAAEHEDRQAALQELMADAEADAEATDGGNR
jgi:hypothetical protein